jgi:DNA modification methylase
MGRDFMGIEIDPGYFEIAKRRIEAAQMQGRLL